RARATPWGWRQIRASAASHLACRRICPGPAFSTSALRSLLLPRPCRKRAPSLSDDDGGAGRGDHQHGAALADHFIVDVHADDGSGADPGGAHAHFGYGVLPGVLQHFLIGRRAAADDVADAGEEIAEDVGARDHLARDDAEIMLHRPAVD